MKYQNLRLLGTSHIAKQSIKEVKEHIEKDQPEIIALELDKGRLAGLLSKKKGDNSVKNIRKVGLKGYLFSTLGSWAEKKLGEQVGVKPGAEMMQAIKLAKKHKIPLALIDQEIHITLKKLSKRLSWKEKWNFVVDIFKAVILRKKEVEFDLATVPEDKVIKKMIDKVKKRYPNIYTILVKERNEIMAKNIARLMSRERDKKILAIIGAGHEKEMLAIIKKELKEHKPVELMEYSFSVEA